VKDIVVSKTIAAAPARVFQSLADIPNAPRTFSSVVKIEMLTPGPIGVGSRWKETRIVDGTKGTKTVEMTQFEPHKRFVTEAVKMGLRMRMTCVVEPSADDAATVTLTMQTTPHNLLGKLLMPMVAGFADAMRAMLEKDLEEVMNNPR